MSFSDKLSIGCAVLSIFVSVLTTVLAARWINSSSAKRNERVMNGIIRILADTFRIELVYDEQGRPTGGQVIRLAGSSSSKTSVNAELTTGPSGMSGAGSVEAA